MKLWLQVLFAQGYLWRDRFPDTFGSLRQERRRVTIIDLVLPILMILMGAVSLYRGSWILGAVIAVTGLAYASVQTGGLGLERAFGSRAFWNSVSWASGAVTVGGMMALFVLSLIWQLWTFSLISLGFMVFFGSMSLHEIQRRYLFFAHPQRNAHMLDDPTWSPRELWLDTYFNFPRAIARTMLGRSPGGER